VINQRQNSTRLLVALTLLLFTHALAGCGNNTGEATLERIQRDGVIRVGYANEAPFAYQDSATGELRGEAPDIARVVLHDLGVEQVEGVLTEFGSLIPGLQAGRFDMIAAGMYITPLRCRQVAFSDPTYSVGEGFIVLAGNPQGLHSYADVANNPQARLGVVAGAVQQGYARELGIPEDRVVIFNDAPSALGGLQAGRIDAYAGTSLTVSDLLGKAQSDAIERAEPFEDPVIDGQPIRGYGAFAFRPQDQELVDAVNAQLADFLGTPAHQELVAPYGFGEEELPGDLSADELCAAAA